MQREVTIDVFHDERILRDEWLYHGLLFVPVDQEDWLIRQLMEARTGYDGFLHYSELRNPPADTPEGRKANVARKWAHFFVADTKLGRNNPQYNNFCVTVLGINLKNLNHECFGAECDRNIYNRFFRTALLSGIRSFYNPQFHIVHVRRVFHGTRDLPESNPLRWHPMWRIETDTDGSVVFAEEELTLGAADHRREATWPAHSQVIQFVDIAMGGFSQCLDYSSHSRGCIEVAKVLWPVVDRLTKTPRNINSRYYGKYHLTFFPSHRLSLEELSSIHRYRSGFYSSRYLKIAEIEQGILQFGADG